VPVHPESARASRADVDDPSCPVRTSVSHLNRCRPSVLKVGDVSGGSEGQNLARRGVRDRVESRAICHSAPAELLSVDGRRAPLDRMGRVGAWASRGEMLLVAMRVDSTAAGPATDFTRPSERGNRQENALGQPNRSSSSDRPFSTWATSQAIMGMTGEVSRLQKAKTSANPRLHLFGEPHSAGAAAPRATAGYAGAA
jgi:hypothetical protein